jgi:hypothetical protein
MIAHRSAAKLLRRSGFGLVEMAMTGVLIVAAMTITAQVIGWVALDRRASERCERAVFEASNLMERISARPWDDLKTENLAAIKPDPSTASFLHDPSINLKVEPFDDAPPRKKLTVEIRWLDRSGHPEAPVRLVAWVYLKGGPGR